MNIRVPVRKNLGICRKDNLNQPDRVSLRFLSSVMFGSHRQVVIRHPHVVSGKIKDYSICR
jgi:hypothetical protein